MIYANTMSQGAAQQTFGKCARIIMQRKLYYDIILLKKEFCEWSLKCDTKSARYRKDVRLYEDRAC